MSTYSPIEVPPQACDGRTDALAAGPPVAAYFDPALNAWILSRYRDVLAAFEEPRLSAAGARNGGAAGFVDETAHLKFRDAALAAFSPTSFSTWRRQAELLAHSMMNRLPADLPVDLVSEFAEPWSLAVAIAVTRAEGDGEHLAGLARDIFAAAVEPRHSGLRLRAEVATAELAHSFQGGLTPLYVQAFVALSQTLPCFLANAWLALLRHPAQMQLLRPEPNLVPSAMEELLATPGRHARNSGRRRQGWKSAARRSLRASR